MNHHPRFAKWFITNRRIALLILTLLMTLGCQSTLIESHRDRSFDFRSVRTFAWTPATGAATGDTRLDNPIVPQIIVNEATDVLESKGLTLDSAGAPDVWITYEVGLRTQLESSRFDNRGRAGWGTELYTNRPIGGAGTYVRTREDGALTILAYDTNHARIIWTATGTRTLDPTANPARRQQRLRETVRKIAAKFPR